MKLVDIFYIHPRYRTTEEVMADPTVKDTNLENVFESESLKNMGASARLASEEALKVRSWCIGLVADYCHRHISRHRNPPLVVHSTLLAAQGHARGSVWKTQSTCSTCRHVASSLHSLTGFHCSTIWYRRRFCRPSHGTATLATHERPKTRGDYDPYPKVARCFV